MVNGIFTDERIFGIIQNLYSTHFSVFKIRYSQTRVEDLTSHIRQDEEIIREHQRAHRNARENRIQLLEKFYFPRMNAKINTVVKQCTTCKEQKYDRRPNKPELGETPIPQYPGHILHVDIYSTEGKLVLTALDKFSKYAQTKVIASRAIEDIKEPLRQIIFAFGVPKYIIVDNEKSFNSATIKFMLEDQLGVELFRTPPYSSFVNGQVERFHSTLSEIMRCLKTRQVHTSFVELLDRAVYEYNCSIHTATKKRPIDIFFGRNISMDPNKLEQARKENIETLKKTQQSDLKQHNKSRQPVKQYNPGDSVYVKVNKRLGSKLSNRFKKEIVKENRSTTILTEAGRIVHKSNIRD